MFTGLALRAEDCATWEAGANAEAPARRHEARTAEKRAMVDILLLVLCFIREDDRVHYRYYKDTTKNLFFIPQTLYLEHVQVKTSHTQRRKNKVELFNVVIGTLST